MAVCESAEAGYRGRCGSLLDGENESYGEVVVVGDGLPVAEDMEGWKKLIMMIGNRIFGYIKSKSDLILLGWCSGVFLYA